VRVDGSHQFSLDEGGWASVIGFHRTGAEAEFGLRHLIPIATPRAGAAMRFVSQPLVRGGVIAQPKKEVLEWVQGMITGRLSAARLPDGIAGAWFGRAD